MCYYNNHNCYTKQVVKQNMSDTVIHIENISKKYIIFHQDKNPDYNLNINTSNGKIKNKRLFGLNVTHGLKYTFRRILSIIYKSAFSYHLKKEEFWALKNISFDVNKGDKIGIIGRNGSGKSTLLKILSRITEPTEGRIHIKGRSSSLLEVGTGFHHELTGRENIYLNGTVLGMTREEINRKFPEIIKFAETEVENFLDTPVKRYSSGMYVRLAFSIAANLEPEILIVDEVLAVGDRKFQDKCLEKMKKEKKTILFVSHNLSAVEYLCNKCVWLHEGSIKEIGSTADVVSHFKEYFEISDVIT